MPRVTWIADDASRPSTVDEVASLLRDGADGFAWVDCTPEDGAGVLTPLALPALVVEDLVDDRHQPKVERIDDVLVLVVHALDVSTVGDELRTVELDMAFDERLLVTWREGSVASVSALHGALREGTVRCDRPFELVHRVLDAMNDVFIPIVEHLDARLDVIEEDVLSEPTQQTRVEIYQLQRDLIQLRRVLVPQAEVVRRLPRERPPGWEPGDDALARDLYDHVNRMVELSGSYRALLDSAMDSYRSALDDELTEMLTTLTVVSTVLLPVTVVAGLLGMNFANIPGAEAARGFWWTVGGCVLLVATMLGWFVRRGWIGGRAERAAARRRSSLQTVLEVPVLGDVLRIPVEGTRAVARTAWGLARRGRGR